MEEEDTIIVQAIFKFEDGRLYNLDVDRTTTFYEIKKILSNAAHILKNSFILFHEGQEYSKEYDGQTLQKIFPNQKKIEFYLKLKKSKDEIDENEHDQISVKYNIKEPCKEHTGKFLVLYCISCKKSICNECFSVSHNNHEVEEKADYLMPAKIIMERIFANSFMFKSDPKISNYMSCVSFRSIIKTDIFDRLRQMVNELESKVINCLEFFSFNEDSTEKNNDLNLELLKKYCTTSFIKLKNNIDTKEILINDEVFLSLYNKLKAIKDYEISFFNENANKYKMLNSFFLPFTQEIKNMSIDLNNILTRYLNKDIYAKFKEDIAKYTVDVVQKEDVIRFMFENLNVTKMSGSSLLKPEENTNKNSLTPNINLRILPSILLFNEQKNNNKQNLNSNINANINNSINNANSINNNMGYQKYTQQNFAITSPIQFSKAGNMNMNFSLFNNTNSMNTLGNMNSLNSFNSLNNANNPLVNNMNNINSMNSASNNNMNNINSISGINNTPIKASNTINSMNNINNAVMKNMSNLNNASSKVINNFSNINSFSNTNNLNSINSVANLNMSTLNNVNSISNSNNTNNMNTINPINNMNSVTNNNNNSILNNINSVANNTNNNSILSGINSVTNVNNTNTNVNNITTMNNMNTVNNNNSSSILNNLNSVNNSNSNNNTVNGIKNFLFLQNVTECNHDATISKDQEKEKKIEKNERMEVEESGDTPPTQNSPNMKNTEINYSQAKIDEIKANLTEKNNVYASPIFSKKALINVHLSPSKVNDVYENKSAITSSNYIQKKNLFTQNSLNEQISDNSNTINNNIENQPGPKNSINAASIFGGKLIDVLNNEITNNSNNNNNSSNNNVGTLQENTEKKDENALSQNAQNISADLNSNSNISNNTNNINSVANANASLLTQRSEKQEANFASSCFMYPVFKTNIIKGAVDKVTVQEMKINFSQFSEEDPLLTEFPSGGAYCNYENFFYFSGGQECIKEASKLFLSISKKDPNQNPNKLPGMINSHWNHSMIADKEKIYVIGGYNSNKCEVYDIQSKTWSELPDLLSPERQRSMLFIEKNFLYCFMGLSQNGILDSVERLNLDNIQAGWERINVDNSENLILKFYGAGIIRMTEENKILFIGGKKESNNEEVYRRSIYEFSFDDFKMTLSDFKIENDLEFVENKLYPIDDTEYGNFINIGDGYLISMPSLTK
mgnify:CR=1 FL=1